MDESRRKRDWALSLFHPLSPVPISRHPATCYSNKPDGWLKYGFLEANGAYYMIVAHVGQTVTLLHGLEGVSVGETVSAYAGCDQTLETCYTKFGNHLNHLGFTWSPAKNLFERGI